eukprot:COSAG02_NODE_1792_length_10916_cov_169.572789_6_plen_82_part_00
MLRNPPVKKKKLEIVTFFFDWWISEHRATLTVGVALINVSQFFFQQITGTPYIRSEFISQAYDQTSLYAALVCVNGHERRG